MSCCGSDNELGEAGGRGVAEVLKVLTALKTLNLRCAPAAVAALLRTRRRGCGSVSPPTNSPNHRRGCGFAARAWICQRLACSESVRLTSARSLALPPLRLCLKNSLILSSLQIRGHLAITVAPALPCP